MSETRLYLKCLKCSKIFGILSTDSPEQIADHLATVNVYCLDCAPIWSKLELEW